MKSISSDRIFVLLVVIITLAGLAIFSSAALGLLARENSSISKDILLQAGFGLGFGLFAFLAARMVPLSWIRRRALAIYGATLLFTAMVFVPGIGFHSGGATRWINLGITTIQPAEFLKIGCVIALAAWLAPRARQLANMKKGLLPFSLLLAVSAAVLLAQPNTSTTMLLVATGLTMYFVAGAPLRDFGILLFGAIVGFGIVALARPYVMQRVLTFLHPSDNALSSGYQIQQSLIAVGSGGVFGRGFGQSVEKFNYLPEPDGDSVFAVFAEETGFVGSVILVLLFLVLAARGIVISGNARDMFEALVAFGFSFLIMLQALINIGAMLGIIPLTGLPLPFVSHGGTALMAALIMCGFILNVAAHKSA
ncbi:putative lipid II flippase FtsW [Patescibacteria group bacterium]|nr:putative lipid II flippase FtsW [Patescibacteria group bacterium]